MRDVANTCDGYSYIESPEDPNDTYESELESEEARKRISLTDSWFGSVKTAEKVVQSGYHCTMIIKTAHVRSLKKWLDEAMTNIRGGI